MNKININEGVFYITNTCNLTCSNCISFNNWKFKGHHFWKEHSEKYKLWSKKLNFLKLNIHGGEPITNPDLYDWAVNLKKLWPNCIHYYISSNGTLLKNKIDLCRKLIDIGWAIDVVVHDPVHYDSIQRTIEEILLPFNYRIKMTDPSCNRIEYTSKKKILISIETAYYFRKNAVNEIKDGVLYMHNSDKEKAHDLCMSECEDGIALVKGALYKCNLGMISEDLLLQFKIEDHAKELLQEFRPVYPTDSDEIIHNFIKSLDNYIPQCSLCPDKIITHPIFPLNPKKEDP